MWVIKTMPFAPSPSHHQFDRWFIAPFPDMGGVSFYPHYFPLWDGFWVSLSNWSQRCSATADSLVSTRPEKHSSSHSNKQNALVGSPLLLFLLSNQTRHNRQPGAKHFLRENVAVRHTLPSKTQAIVQDWWRQKRPFSPQFHTISTCLVESSSILDPKFNGQEFRLRLRKSPSNTQL